MKAQLAALMGGAAAASAGVSDGALTDDELAEKARQVRGKSRRYLMWPYLGLATPYVARDVPPIGSCSRWRRDAPATVCPPSRPALAGLRFAP